MIRGPPVEIPHFSFVSIEGLPFAVALDLNGMSRLTSNNTKWGWGGGGR